MSDARQVKELLRARVTDLAPYLYPNGKRDGGHWCVGNVNGDPGKSFKICLAGEKAGLWGDFADSEKHRRSLLDLWMQARNVDFKTALHEAAQWTGQPLNGFKPRAIAPLAPPENTYPRANGSVNGEKPHAPPFDWQKCVATFTDKHVGELASWRGYSREFCEWLSSQKLVGLYGDCVALPVHDSSGTVVGAHYRIKPKTKEERASWCYTPRGVKAAPLVIGEVNAGDPIHVFESQFDAFAFMDKSGERSGVFITRGSGNGALAAGLIPVGSPLYAWKQNDQLKNGKRAGDEWLKAVIATTKAKVLWAKTPEQHADVNDWLRAGATVDDLFKAIEHAEVIQQAPRPLIEFKRPSELKNYVPSPDIMLVGDCHVVRGSVFVIGGAPGVGKSRASVALAEAGATGHDWFGLTVHRKFKTMVIQTENGLFRLSKELGELDCDALEDYVRICEPPPYGLCFERDEFKDQLSKAIREFQPAVVIFDPWNAVARDEKARQYLETFEELRSVLPLGDNAPALGIVAHTRKPKTDERASGRALLNLLAGSYVLGSVPRTVFVMQAASDETTDSRIVWTCCKNNDGELGRRSAWERCNGLFDPVTDFDWDTFDTPEKDRRETIGETDVRAVFADGPLTKPEAAKLLESNTGAHRTSCYRALEPSGRFGKHLRVDEEDRINWE